MVHSCKLLSAYRVLLFNNNVLGGSSFVSRGEVWLGATVLFCKRMYPVSDGNICTQDGVAYGIVVA